VFAWSVGIALVIGQVAAALHYWPLSPLRFGLLILGLAYALPVWPGRMKKAVPGARFVD
jgi:hypothetical protein